MFSRIHPANGRGYVYKPSFTGFGIITVINSNGQVFNLLIIEEKSLSLFVGTMILAQGLLEGGYHLMDSYNIRKLILHATSCPYVSGLTLLVRIWHRLRL